MTVDVFTVKGTSSRDVAPVPQFFYTPWINSWKVPLAIFLSKQTLLTWKMYLPGLIAFKINSSGSFPCILLCHLKLLNLAQPRGYPQERVIWCGVSAPRAAALCSLGFLSAALMKYRMPTRKWTVELPPSWGANCSTGFLLASLRQLPARFLQSLQQVGLQFHS